MSRPHFLRAYPEWGDTEGHTQPAAHVPGVRVVSEAGALLDARRVIPPHDWLSDLELGQLAANDEPAFRLSWPGITDEERERRIAMRERLRQVNEEDRTTHRQWLLWAAALAVGVIGAWLVPEGWGYGWHW